MGYGVISCGVISGISSYLIANVSLEVIRNDSEYCKEATCHEESHYKLIQPDSATNQLNQGILPSRSAPWNTFRGEFIILVVYAALSSFFSIIHDWSLIYYQRKNDLPSLAFWPSNLDRNWRDDFFLTKWTFRLCHFPIFKLVGKLSKRIKYCCCLVFCPVVALYVILSVMLYIVCGMIDFALTILLLRPLCRCKPQQISMATVTRAGWSVVPSSRLRWLPAGRTAFGI